MPGDALDEANTTHGKETGAATPVPDSDRSGELTGGTRRNEAALSWARVPRQLSFGGSRLSCPRLSRCSASVRTTRCFHGTTRHAARTAGCTAAAAAGAPDEHAVGGGVGGHEGGPLVQGAPRLQEPPPQPLYQSPATGRRGHRRIVSEPRPTKTHDITGKPRPCFRLLGSSENWGALSRELYSVSAELYIISAELYLIMKL